VLNINVDRTFPDRMAGERSQTLNAQLQRQRFFRKSRGCSVYVSEPCGSEDVGSIESSSPPTDCGPAGSWAAVTLNLTVLDIPIDCFGYF